MSPDAVLLSFSGLAGLALAQARFRPGKGWLPSMRLARRGGIALLVWSYVVAVVRGGAGFGTVQWLAQLCLAGIALVLLLSWRARAAGPVAAVALTVGLLLAVMPAPF